LISTSSITNLVNDVIINLSVAGISDITHSLTDPDPITSNFYGFISWKPWLSLLL
jgi:hypothetical protein